MWSTYILTNAWKRGSASTLVLHFSNSINNLSISVASILILLSSLPDGPSRSRSRKIMSLFKDQKFSFEENRFLHSVSQHVYTIFRRESKFIQSLELAEYFKNITSVILHRIFHHAQWKNWKSIYNDEVNVPPNDTLGNLMFLNSFFLINDIDLL